MLVGACFKFDSPEYCLSPVFKEKRSSYAAADKAYKLATGLSANTSTSPDKTLKT
jgi:hypothetical protein